MSKPSKRQENNADVSGVADQVRVADHTQAIGFQGRPQDDIGDDDGLAGVQGDRRKHRGTQKMAAKVKVMPSISMVNPDPSQ